MGRKKKAIVLKRTSVLTALCTSAVVLTILFTNGKKVSVPSYTVLRVIDDDTFETTEKQLVCLASVGAPELEYCGGVEAKTALAHMILNKPIYLKVVFRDMYDRLVSEVYTEDGYVNDKMIRDSYIYYANKAGLILSDASAETHVKKRRILSEPCTQTTNPNSVCVIKGNNRKEKIYFIPSC